MIKILPNKEEMTQKKEETKEYNDYIKKMKKFNPRLAEEGGFRKTLKNNSTKKADMYKYFLNR